MPKPEDSSGFGHCRTLTILQGSGGNTLDGTTTGSVHYSSTMNTLLPLFTAKYGVSRQFHLQYVDVHLRLKLVIENQVQLQLRDWICNFLPEIYAEHFRYIRNSMPYLSKNDGKVLHRGVRESVRNEAQVSKWQCGSRPACD